MVYRPYRSAANVEVVEVPAVTARNKQQFEFAKTFSLMGTRTASHADMLEAFQREKAESGMICYVPYSRDVERHRQHFEGFKEWIAHQQSQGFHYHTLVYQDVVVAESEIYVPPHPDQALKTSDGGHLVYYVHPDHRRKGLASLLLQKSCAVLGARGVQSIQAVVAESNGASVGVLEKVMKAGFAGEGKGDKKAQCREFFIQPDIPDHVFWPRVGGKGKKPAPRNE